MVGQIVHGGLGDRADQREVEQDAEQHHQEVEYGERDRPT